MNFTKLTDHLKLATDRLIGFKPEPYELHEGHGVATESIYKMVDQFHELFQHPRRVMPTPELLRLRASLIHEEAVVEGIPAQRMGILSNCWMQWPTFYTLVLVRWSPSKVVFLPA